jgi:hypothetical protein
MSDGHLQSLARRWRESGLPRDGAEYLAERTRVGRLSSAEIELAALCGHEAARLAQRSPRQPLEDWRSLLDKAQKVLGTRRLISASLSLFSSESESLPESLGEVLTAVEAWVRDPSPTHSRSCESAGIRAEELADAASTDEELRLATALGFLAAAAGRSSGSSWAAPGDLVDAIKSMRWPDTQALERLRRSVANESMHSYQPSDRT